MTINQLLKEVEKFNINRNYQIKRRIVPFTREELENELENNTCISEVIADFILERREENGENQWEKE